MRKLKEFPLFMAGCHAIMLDSGCGHGPEAHVLNPEAETLHYTDAIEIIEGHLKSLKGKTIQQFIPEMLKMKYYEDVRPEEFAIEYVYLGMNDSTKLVLAKLGLSPLEIWAVEHVFDQFFEGELHKQFTKAIGKRTKRRTTH